MRSFVSASALDSSLARPKSRIFTWPAVVMMMFAGLRSRCTMPAACALRVPGDLRADVHDSSIGIGPRSSRCFSVSPG